MNMVTLVIEIVIFTALIGTIAVSVSSGGNLSGAMLKKLNLVDV